MSPDISQPPLQLGWGHVTGSDQCTVSETIYVTSIYEGAKSWCAFSTFLFSPTVTLEVSSDFTGVELNLYWG